jgi:hypothetical protein
MTDAVNANPETGASTESQDFDPTTSFERLLDKAPAEETSQEKEPPAAEETPPSEGEPESAKEEPDERVYKVKVNGQEIEVKESELLAGYQRDRDYRIKTEQLGEQRRAVDAEVQQARQERAQLARQLEAYLTMPSQVQPPDPSLIEQDPVAYLKSQREYEQEVLRRQQGQYQLQQLQQQMQAEQAAQMQEQLQTEKEKLLQVIPEWKDEATAKAEQKDLRDFLTKAGYGDDVINSITDHRVVTLARKAMLYDRMVAQANAAAKQVRQAPPKVERPGTATASDIRATDGRTEAMKALKRSGSTDAAAALFEKMF